METKNESCESCESRVDLIKTDPKKAILKLFPTMMLFMVLMMGYMLIDTIWIAGLGYDAIAASGFVSPIYMIMIGVGMGLGTGAISLISRSIGEENRSKANNVALHSILISTIISIALTIVFVVFLKDILILIGAKSVLTPAMEYGLVIFIGTFPFIINLLLSSILRAEGDAKNPTYAMIAVAVINIVLDPVFIYSFNMGIAGAAVVTVLGSVAANCYMLYWILVKKNSYISFNIKDFKFNLSIIKEILNVSLPISLEEMMLSFSTLLMNTMLVIAGGSMAVAVYTATWKIFSLSLLPAMSIESAVLTVAGVAIGAKNFKNLEISSNYGIKIGVVLGGILAVLSFVFAPQLAYLFSYSFSDPALVNGVVELIRILAVVTIAVPFGMVSTAIFQGAGKGVTSFMLNFTRDIFFVLISAYILGFILGLGTIGIYFGIAIGFIVGSIVNYICYRIYLSKLKEEKDFFYKDTVSQVNS